MESRNEACVEVALDNFASLSARGSGSAELLEKLQSVLDAGSSGDTVFREMVKSEVLGDAHIVLASREACSRFSTNEEPLSGSPLWLDIGCVSKLVTATTLLSVCRGHTGLLQQGVADILEIDGAGWLSSITLDHLLNHTHGIDEPQGIVLPTLSNGKIDVPAVMSLMGKAPLYPAGRMYSYACVGPWLIAAVLEKKFGERFVNVVRQIFPNILPIQNKDDALCPALGAGVKINAEQLLKEFVKVTTFATPLESRVVKLGPALSIPYPGWHPQERAVCAGWKAYSNGWFGHQAILTNTPMMTRVSPADGIGFLISSRSVHPWRILGSVFAENLVGRPTPIRQAPYWSGDARRMGLYERIDSRIAISADGSDIRMDAIHSSAANAGADPVRWSSPMRPIGHELFSVSWSFGNDATNSSFFEFIRDSSGEVTHLWNGGMVWRKVA